MCRSDEDWPGGSGDMEKGCRTCWSLTISKADCGEETVSVEKEAGMGEEKGFSRSTQSSGPPLHSSVWGGVHGTQ